jgi:hypothetical protein
MSRLETVMSCVVVSANEQCEYIVYPPPPKKKKKQKKPNITIELNKQTKNKITKTQNNCQSV